MPSSAPSTTQIYTLSLHDALPIYRILLDKFEPTFGELRGRRLNAWKSDANGNRSEEHTSELQSLRHLVCRLLLPAPPRSTLFPYTTLFRSTESYSTSSNRPSGN